jgi:hypothetical protein
MKDYPIKLEGHFDAKQVEIAVEKCSRDLGLLESLRGTLASTPDVSTGTSESRW